MLTVLLVMNLNVVQASEENPLIKIAQDYLQFVHDVGSARSVEKDDIRISTLFAENLTKIVNGSVLFANNRQLLLPQMKGFEKEDNLESRQAAWIVHENEALIVPSTETNAVIVSFEWTHVHVGRATAMAILHCNEQRQIERITDVWAKVTK